MSQARLNIRVDEDLKKEAEKMYSQMGMNLSTAVTVFLRQSVHDRSMPFQPNLNDHVNLQAIREAESGNTEKFNTVDEWWDDLNAD